MPSCRRDINFSPPSFQERDAYGVLVEELGGKVLDSQQFHQSCTHLIISKLVMHISLSVSWLRTSHYQ